MKYFKKHENSERKHRKHSDGEHGHHHKHAHHTEFEHDEREQRPESIISAELFTADGTPVQTTSCNRCGRLVVEQ